MVHIYDGGVLLPGSVGIQCQGSKEMGAVCRGTVDIAIGNTNKDIVGRLFCEVLCLLPVRCCGSRELCFDKAHGCALERSGTGAVCGDVGVAFPIWLQRPAGIYVAMGGDTGISLCGMGNRKDTLDVRCAGGDIEELFCDISAAYVRYTGYGSAFEDVGNGIHGTYCYPVSVPLYCSGDIYSDDDEYKTKTMTMTKTKTKG